MALGRGAGRWGRTGELPRAEQSQLPGEGGDDAAARQAPASLMQKMSSLPLASYAATKLPVSGKAEPSSQPPLIEVAFVEDCNIGTLLGEDFL